MYRNQGRNPLRGFRLRCCFQKYVTKCCPSCISGEMCILAVVFVPIFSEITCMKMSFWPQGGMSALNAAPQREGLRSTAIESVKTVTGSWQAPRCSDICRNQPPFPPYALGSVSQFQGHSCSRAWRELAPYCAPTPPSTPHPSISTHQPSLLSSTSTAHSCSTNSTPPHSPTP